MTSVKIVTVDYYLSYPVKDLDVCYSEFRGTEVRQVPVLQIFGSTPDGTKTCLHIHGVLPYIYIPYDGVEPAARLSYQLAAEIDRTLNVSLGQASANTCFVHNILLVSGIPLYGYHEREHQYFKIFFYNPMIVKKACSLLENGVILGKHFQPHESHINYVLQFMIDYNLQGMNYIQLSRVMYRTDTERPRALDAIPPAQILPATVQRRSFARLECDAMARDIVNIEEVSSGQLAVNPGLAALWDDEKQRRRQQELDSQISFCLTQDRVAPKSTASHQVFKQKLRDKLAQPASLSDSGSIDLERSVYPAETPTDVALLNASVVLSNNETNASGRAVLSDALTTPSNETNAGVEVTGQADMSVLHLLEDLKANADATVLEDSVIESSQPDHDGFVFKLLQELREGANVEEDSILSQTLVQEDQPSSEDEQDEQNLSLPMQVQVSETAQHNEFDDDDSVWENSYWDENCEIPQMDGQCDSSSTNTTCGSSSSSDEMDNIKPVAPDFGQAVQMADKHYILHIPDFPVSDSDDWDDDVRVSPKQDRMSSSMQYYQQEDDNCCFPDTDLQITEAQATLRKANEVYLGQNHRGTLTNSQLLTPGINILKPITPRRNSAHDHKKIEITQVIINPGLNVSVSRLARDLCTVQIEGKTSLPGNNANNDKTVESETNSNPLPSNTSWKRNFTAAMFTDALATHSNVNDSEQSAKDTEPAAPDTGRRQRRKKYSSFTKSHKAATAQTTSFPYRYIRPVHAETYDLRSKHAEPRVETYFSCPPEKTQRTLGDTCTGCVKKRKRTYRKTVGKPRNKGRKVTEDSSALEVVTNEHGATFGLDTIQAINSPGKTRNETVENTEEHAENSLRDETCEQNIPMDLSKSSARVNTSSSCTMRMKRKQAAQCEHRIRRIHELENSGGSDEAERPKRPVPVKRAWQVSRSKRIAQIRALQCKLRKLERPVRSRYDSTSHRMRLAMRFRRLQREHSEQNDGSTQYYCEMIDGNTANAANTRAQNNMRNASVKLAGPAQSNHNLGVLVTNVVSIAGTAETIDASDNMSSVPINKARDDCIIYEVIHSANCSTNSRAVAPVALSSSDTDKTTQRINAALPTSASELHTDAAAENTPGVSEAIVAEQPAKAPPSQVRRRTLRMRRGKACDNCNTAAQTNSSRTCRKPKHNDESGTSQNELAISIHAIQQPPEVSAVNKEIQPELGIVQKKFRRWNVDGANDTLSSTDTSLPEQQLSMVTQRRKQTGTSNKSSDKPGETVKVSSDSAMDKLVKSIQKQTRNTSKQLRARRQLESPKTVAKQPLLTKQLQVSLVPLEFLTTASKTMEQQSDKTATTDASNSNHTPYKSKLKPTQTSPRFSTLAVTIHSPKSKRHAKQTADLKRTKIAKNLKKRRSKRIAQIRALQCKLRKLERAVSRLDGTLHRMRLAMRFRRLQREHSEQNDGSTQQYYGEMIDGNSRNNTANAGQVAENTRGQTNMLAGRNASEKLAVKYSGQSTSNHNVASNNISLVPVSNARDDCIRYEVIHSANWSTNSRAAAPVEYAALSSSALSTSASELHTDASDENTTGVSEGFVAVKESRSSKSSQMRIWSWKLCDHCKEIKPMPGVVDKKFIRWNVDGANDTLSSSDSSLPEQQLSMVTRRRKPTGKPNKTGDTPVNVTSDSAMGKLVKSIQKQTRSTSKQQLESPKLKSSKLLTKQLQVSLVPLEFLTTTASKTMKQQSDKTATTEDASNSIHGNTPYKSKLKPTRRTSPRFSTLAVTIRSPKSKRHAKQTAEPADLKRTKIAKNLKKRRDSSGKDDTMESDRNGRSGELQMFGIVPIIQNSNTGKKPPSRSLNSNTTCDIVNQNNSVPTSIISEPSQCDKTRIKVKKQLFANKPPPRKTIIVNINTDTNTTFVEEQKVCSYEKSRRNSVVPKFVQIQRLKDLIANEEQTFPAERLDTSKMAADDTFNFQRPAAVPPSDIFEPTCDDDTNTTDTCDLFSDTNCAANLKYYVEHTLAHQNRDVTSTSRDIYNSAPIVLNDEPVRRTHLDTSYVHSEFNSYDNNTVTQYERTPENPPRQHEEEDEEEAWFPVICYEDEDELTTAQLYDLQRGFVPQPGTSTQVASYVRCARLCEYETYDHKAVQAAIMQSLLDQQAKKQAELADMQYDPDCDGEPLVEEPEDSSLSFEPHKESIDWDTMVSSTDNDSLAVNNASCSITEVDMDQWETCDNNIHSEYPSCSQSDKYEQDKTEITNSVQPSEQNGDISNEEKDDAIIEDTPAKSSIQIFTLLHTTTIPNEIRTRLLMPKYHAPTRHDIMSTLAEYNIPECRHQEPFYSNAADVTGKMDVGHNVLKIPSNTIQDLEEFKSCTGFPGLDTWRREKFRELYPDVDASKINFHIAFAGQSKVVMVPGVDPPTRQQAEQWVEDKRQASSAEETPVILPKPKMYIPLSPSGDMDDSMSETMTLSPCTPTPSLKEDSQINTASAGQRKASGNMQRRALFSQTVKPGLNLSDTSVHNNSHQITGVNVDSTVELQNLQHAKPLTQPLNLTTMVVELYVRTRGDLYPNPQYDAVRAIFYSILNDVPAAGAALPREETGVLVVNTLDDGSHSNLLDGSGVTCSVLYVQSEAELMTAFVQLVRKWDPDICAGYEIEMHSWGYLIERGNVLGVNLTSELSRINPAVVKQRPAKADSDEKDVQLTGRIILDVWRLLRHEVALQSYTFENTTYHILHRRVPKFSYQRLTFYWEYKGNLYRHITAKYYILRVQSVLQILDQLDLIGRTSELAKLFGIQFYEVLSRGSQFRVESMMLRLAKPLNYIPVSPSVTQRAKMRAPEFLPLIFEPESRFYADPVIVLDFQSLYPSIIIAYNYCFSTCIGRVELLGTNQPFEFGACQLKVPRETLRNLDHNINFSPCGVGFVKPEVRQGILPRMLKEILETRLMVKSAMKENRHNKLLQRVLHSRQLGLKLIANVTYGYTAANFSGRMPCIEVGDSVVSKGRETLERAIKLIEQTPKWRAKVVYGDTDSVFVMVAGRSKAEAFRIGAEIAEAVTNDNPAPVKLKLEKVFLPCILQTKKRYVGYMYESVDQVVPEYCAKGIETVRRDGCPAVAKMLENTLRTLFESRDVSLVKRYVCRQFSKLLTGRVSIQDLTFAREYRGASGYRPGACVPALVLARKWAVTDKRREPRRGERVPYVIVNGPPGLPLIRLVRCPRELLADPSRLRPNAVYYITRVIAPALNRCFTLIGADVLTWYNEMPRRQLQQLPTEDASNVKKSTISQYFATTSCAVCGQQSRDGLCESCAKDPQQSVVVLYMKINNWERSYDEVSLICESCCGRKTDCNSLDCPVLYRLNQLRRDLRQVPYVRRQIAKFTDE